MNPAEGSVEPDERPDVTDAGGTPPVKRSSSETGSRLSTEWLTRSGEDQKSTAIAEYERELRSDTTLVVTVEEHVENVDYELRLTAVDCRQHVVRHGHAVMTFETESAALEGSEEFLVHLEDRLASDSLSSTEPTPREIGDAIGSFIDVDSANVIDRIADRLLP